MIGSGIFSLPQNMAAGAGAGAILLGWLVAGAGMLALASVYQSLAMRQPELDNGVYAYARAAGGDLAGFGSAWGYWISAWIGNAGYLVIFFSALGTFAPVFGEGNNAAAIVAASLLLWLLHGLTLAGIRNAAFANMLTTVAKLLPLMLFVLLAAVAFRIDTFKADFWATPRLGSVLDQVKSTMLVTVWVFIGIEGASVFSARAERRSDVGRATLIGFGLGRCLSKFQADGILTVKDRQICILDTLALRRAAGDTSGGRLPDPTRPRQVSRTGPSLPGPA